MKPEFRLTLLTFVVVAVVYLATSAPGLGLVDSGELTTAAASLSIAHPSGYPLYTLLGRIWLLLMPANPARAMVLFSVIAGALTSGLLALVASRLLDGIGRLSNTLRLVFAGLLGLGFAFSSTAWHAVSFAEVYPLTAVLVSLLLVLALSYREDQPRAPYIPLLLCYLWGLGFGNHLTILWFAPLVLFIVIRHVRAAVRRVPMLISCAALFALGASVNLFLPIRSSVQPLLDWSNPEQLDGLIRHLTGWQYRVWMFKGGLGMLLIKTGNYLSTLPRDFGWGLTALAVAGIIALLRRRSGVLWMILLCWLLGTVYNLNYEIPDISTYFFTFYAALFVIAVLGAAQLAQWIEPHVKHPGALAGSLLLVAVLVPVLGIAGAWPAANQRRNRFAETVAREILDTLPDSALVFHGIWDIQSPALYLQHVERLRPDIALLDIALLQRPWYITQQQRLYPDVFAGSEREIEQFVTAVAPFEAGKPYDGSRIEAAFIALNHRLITSNLPRRPVYLRDQQYSGHPGIGRGFPERPGSYFFRVAAAPESEPILNAERILNSDTHFDARDRILLGEMARSASFQARYATAIGDSLTRRRATEAALTFVRDDPQTLRLVREALTIPFPSPNSPQTPR